MEPVKTSQLLRGNCVVERIGAGHSALPEWIAATDAYLTTICVDPVDENIWGTDARSQSRAQMGPRPCLRRVQIKYPSAAASLKVTLVLRVLSPNRRLAPTECLASAQALLRSTLTRDRCAVRVSV